MTAKSTFVGIVLQTLLMMIEYTERFAVETVLQAWVIGMNHKRARRRIFCINEPSKVADI